MSKIYKFGKSRSVAHAWACKLGLVARARPDDVYIRRLVADRKWHDVYIRRAVRKGLRVLNIGKILGSRKMTLILLSFLCFCHKTWILIAQKRS